MKKCLPLHSLLRNGVGAAAPAGLEKPRLKRENKNILQKVLADSKILSNFAKPFALKGAREH